MGVLSTHFRQVRSRTAEEQQFLDLQVAQKASALQVLDNDFEQLLFEIGLELVHLRERAADNHQELETEARETRDLLKRTIEGTRQVTGDLAPQVLESADLREALARLIGHRKRLDGLNAS